MIADVLERAIDRRRGVGQARPGAAAGRCARPASSTPAATASPSSSRASSPRCAATRRRRSTTTPAARVTHPEHDSVDVPLLHELRGHRLRPGRAGFVARARGDRRLRARRRRRRDAEGPRPHRRPRAGDGASSTAPARSRTSTSPTCTRRSSSARRADARRPRHGSTVRAGEAPMLRRARGRHRRGPARRCSRASARTSLDGGPTLNPSTYELLAGDPRGRAPRRSSCCRTAPT